MFGRTMSVMRDRVANNGRSVGRIRQSSVISSSSGVAPLVPFRRLPGIPPVAITRLPDDAPAHSGLPGAGPHAHDFLVLFYAHRADGTVVIDGRPWTVADGHIFVIAPGQVVALTDPHHQVVTEAWAAAFPADVIRPGTAGAYASWRAHPLLFPFARGVDRAQRFRVPAPERPRWVERFAALDTELRTRRDGYHEAVLAHLTLLLVAVSRLSTDVARELQLSNEPLLAAVFDVIEQRYHEPLSLTDVAADLALSAGHLTTVVRRKTGRTVQQWITERRMQQARLLLAETDQTVAALSRRVGYPDVSYFIKRFRADHGMTPAQWRNAALPGRPSVS
jgi:AraC-like DNA-binding protein